MLHSIRKWVYLVYIVFTINLLSFSGGMIFTWSSPVIPKLTNHSRMDENPLGRVISKTEASWLGSLLTVGAMIVPIFCSYSLDKIGRKFSLILTGIPYLMSSLLLAFCTEIEWYYVARVLGGLSLGSSLIVVPTYTAEIADKHIRGILGAFISIFMTVGILFAFAVGPYVSVMWYGIVFAVFPLLFLVLSIRLPESPYHLVKKEDFDGAIKVLISLKLGKEVGESELDKNAHNENGQMDNDLHKQGNKSDCDKNVQNSIEHVNNDQNQNDKNDHDNDKNTWNTNLDTISKDIDEMKYYIQLGSEGKLSDLFNSKAALVGLVGSCLLMVFQQLSGINPIIFFAESLFADSGTAIPPEICSIIFGATQAAATLITPFFVDSFGRKTLSVVSSFGMLISEIPLGAYFYFLENGHDVSGWSWMPIACLVVFMVAFNLGSISVPFIYMSEIFPESIKYAALTIANIVKWLMAFILTVLFMPMEESMGLSGIFFFYGAFNVLAIVFVVFYIPETKGKSLQEIQDMLEKKSIRR